MLRNIVTYLILPIVALLLSITATTLAGSAQSHRITGNITDQENNPVIGASVVFCVDDEILSGCPTDTLGRFTKSVTTLEHDSIIVKVSSVGYKSMTAVIFVNRFHDTTVVDFQLKQETVEMGALKVKPEETHSKSTISLDRERIIEAATQSLIPTNPISAIKQPQVIREGSIHSSKININGTKPKYYINGIEIGSDPNHFGAFSIIPASVVQKMTFQPQGTSSHLVSPSAVKLSTGRPFEKHIRGDINLSLIEATGSFSIGGSRYFTLGSLRKSLLDKLVRRFDVHSNRRVLPPTNFQDIFGSSGLKLSGHHFLFLDQYHVRDFLSYKTDATTKNPEGVNITLHTEERFFGLRWEAVYDRVFLKVGAAVRLSSEEYQASPGNLNEGIKLYLTSDRQTNLGNIEVSFPLGSGLLTVGNQLEHVSKNNVNMTQQNWNFQPPDANTDNPFIYQPELNQLYDTYSGNFNELNNALFTSVTQSSFGVKLESGFRAQYFGSLDNGTVMLFRNRVNVRTGKTGILSLFLGTFAENPVRNILEPYQVLIQADRNNLKPIMTQLASVDFSTGKLELGLFTKRIYNLPALTVDFDHVNNGSVEEGFIAMQSNGQLDFYGGDITLELDSLLSSPLDLYTFYSYTHAEKMVNGVITPYELNSPHQLYAKMTYRLSRVISVAGEGSLRSGFAYTPTRSVSAYQSHDRLTEQFYKSSLGSENSARFPLNATLSFHMNFNLGNAQLFYSVVNVTDRANPIINTADGFIYDAGILPSVGLRWRF